MQFDCITILGPTATGKTGLAVKLADKFGGEIISADSRQVYKYMDIGTGKDLSEYTFEDRKIVNHLIDILQPSEEFNVFNFQKLFYKAYELCRSRQKIPFLVGGTGMYIHAVLKGYCMQQTDNGVDPKWEKMPNEELRKLLKERNPNLHNTTDLLNRERIINALQIAGSANYARYPKINSLVLGVDIPREEIKERLTARLKERLKSGMFEEAEKLIAMGISQKILAFFGLEYKSLSRYLRGDLNYNDMYQKLNSAIHKFAKRQMTWFRKMEREGIVINWLDGPNFEQAVELIEGNFFRDE